MGDILAASLRRRDALVTVELCHGPGAGPGQPRKVSRPPDRVCGPAHPIACRRSQDPGRLAPRRACAAAARRRARDLGCSAAQHARCGSSSAGGRARRQHAATGQTASMKRDRRAAVDAPCRAARTGPAEPPSRPGAPFAGRRRAGCVRQHCRSWEGRIRLRLCQADEGGGARTAQLRMQRECGRLALPSPAGGALAETAMMICW